VKNKNLTGDCDSTSELAQEFLHITAYLANFEPVMKLSGDQKRLVKFFAVLYVAGSSVPKKDGHK
jgi:hypothetical protein